MTLRSLLPTLVLSLALAACAKASDDALLGGDDDDAAGGSAGQSAGGQAGKGGSGGKSGAAGKGGSSSGTSGQSGEGGSDGGQAGEEPGGGGGSDAGGAGEGGKAGEGGASAGQGGSSGTSGQGGAGQSGAGQAGTGTAGTSGCQPIVVINEVSNDGVDGYDEFVELYNASGCKIDIAGWTLAYYSNNTSSLQIGRNDLWQAPSSQPLAAGGYLVLAGASFQGNKDAALKSGSGLGKSAAGLALFDASNKVVDRMAWGNVDSDHPCIEGAKCAAIASGMSAARIPNGTDTDNNAVDFKVNVARTPGQPNP